MSKRENQDRSNSESAPGASGGYERCVVDDANIARTIFALYREHGLGKFANWITLKSDCVRRSEVVDALRFPETEKAAQKLIRYYHSRIEEIESMIAEARSS